MKPFSAYNLILASNSPRRKQLMSEAGYQFKVVSINVDESFPKDLKSEKVAEYIAKKKAKHARSLLNANEIIITADSVVINKGKILEKPSDSEEARVMLESLSGGKHKVMTGVCFISKDHSLSFSSTTKVTFDDLSKEEINYYIDNYKPFDKAGAYGIQEWIGHNKVKSIKGSYTNVMGLPMAKLYHKLLHFIEMHS